MSKFYIIHICYVDKPTYTFFTDKRIDYVTIDNDQIISLIRKIYPKKATGSDGISGQMLLLCDESVILPLQIIFTNILSTSIYPDMWKIANVTPIYKKSEKQLIKNYRPISLLPICGQIIEKIIFNNLYTYLRALTLVHQKVSISDFLGKLLYFLFFSLKVFG